MTDDPKAPQAPAAESGDGASRVRAAIRTELAADAVDEADAAATAADAAAKAPDSPGTTAEPTTTTPVIELRHVSLSFDRPILDDISFVVQDGETVVIVGESGTGKSTILKLILRLLRPNAGEVFVKGQDVTKLTFEEALQARQCLGMVFQGSALFDSLCVLDNVAYPLREHTKLDDDQIEQRVRETLQYVDLDPDQVMTLSPAELSGGMQKRVGIARGLAARPEIMLYDEPTSGLDPLTTATISNLILKLQHDLDVTSVVVSHDIRSAFRIASKVALLAEQHITFFGTPEEMTASEDPYIQRFLGGY
ncbi:MAG TPA: ATP-binding cassette domain-containing protein [Gemmatimonadaceae bacterium]|jgi:phospholipid/cholesterol/gamma-HCH transport system ATP-binding protein|nr:ATP-binding cassette domain-containing protein [Gemmatimonadaceae bacterium]